MTSFIREKLIEDAKDAHELVHKVFDICYEAIEGIEGMDMVPAIAACRKVLVPLYYAMSRLSTISNYLYEEGKK